MYIESLTLTNFRCFGPGRTQICFSPDITAFIGANGAGKSSCVEALRRVFGETRLDRTLTRADVHFGPGEKIEDVEERQVVIDVVFALPELASDAPEAERTVPEVFRVMTASGPGQPLKVRMRLEALWRRGESYVDEIDTKLYWISNLNDDIGFGDEGGASLDKQVVLASDRNKIRLIYIPATRDGNAVTKHALRNMLRRLERSGDFGARAEKKLQDASKELQETLDRLPAIKWITKKLEENWGRLHESHHLKTPRLAILTQEFVQLLRSLTVTLGPSPDGRDRGIDELSEGQTSLFFLAISATVAELEKALAEGTPPRGFGDLDIAPPVLTIYALEEPENHLAPFYLTRSLKLLNRLCEGPQAMGIVTSHAPSVMRRIPPESVQHFRLDTLNLVSKVNSITLPEDTDEAAKFVRQAVLSHPELYFARLVILGEGDSEEEVIPRIAQALRVELDPSFVAFVPLGGRHVNHFWRLLNDLQIPFLTLLDFDLGRHGAGPLRMKYAHDQLAQTKAVRPRFQVKGDPSQTDYWKKRRSSGIKIWRNFLKKQGVFFSFPLDLDMMMLQAFPKAYGVPKVGTKPSPSKLISSVFGQGEGLKAYSGRLNAPEREPTIEELFCYDSLFKQRSKPASHIKALGELSDEEIAANCPAPLEELIRRAADELQLQAFDDLVEG